MTIVLSTVSFLLAFVSILTITGLGGMFSEKSGTVALSLEGCMTIAALCAGITMHLLPESMPNGIAALIVILVAIAGGGLY